MWGSEARLGTSTAGTKMSGIDIARSQKQKGQVYGQGVWSRVVWPEL